MKALELLKADRDYLLCINNDKSIIQKYDEAIKELEDLKNRSCATCKYDRDIQCFNVGDDIKDVNFDKKFYCSNWESI